MAEDGNDEKANSDGFVQMHSCSDEDSDDITRAPATQDQEEIKMAGSSTGKTVDQDSNQKATAKKVNNVKKRFTQLRIDDVPETNDSDDEDDGTLIGRTIYNGQISPETPVDASDNVSTKAADQKQTTDPSAKQA